MGYVSKYITLDYVAKTFLGSAYVIDANSEPSGEDVSRIIEEEETDVDYRKCWGKVTITDEMVDVAEHNKPPYNMLATDAFRYFKMNAVMVMPKYPIRNVIKCEVNTKGEDEVPSWETRDAHPASDSDFMILQQMIYNKMIGFALKFHQNAPRSGHQKVRITYEAGYDLPDSVLREYVGLRVAMRVMEIMAMNDGSMDLEKGKDASRFNKMRERLAKLEKDIPSAPRDVYIIV